MQALLRYSGHVLCALLHLDPRIIHLAEDSCSLLGGSILEFLYVSHDLSRFFNQHFLHFLLLVVQVSMLACSFCNIMDLGTHADIDRLSLE